MIDIDKAIVSVLAGATGLKVFPIKKPLTASVPCIVYRRITASDLISHSGNENFTTDRIQIIATHTSYTGLRNLVKTIEGVLIANKTNWNISIPTNIKFDDYDEEDKVYSCSRDYFFTYNS